MFIIILNNILFIYIYIYYGKSGRKGGGGEYPLFLVNIFVLTIINNGDNYVTSVRPDGIWSR